MKIISAMIDGKKHYCTGGISKQLPLFSDDIKNAYKYSEANAKSKFQKWQNLKETSRAFSDLNNLKVEEV